MKGKMTPHIIAVTALVIFIVLGLACATVPSGPPPTYGISTKPVAEGFLQGKKAVIFNITMVERGSAALQDRERGGGIFNVIGAGVALKRVSAFNKSAKAFDEANASDLQEFINSLDELIETAWQRAYKTETVSAVYDFGRTTPKVNYFNKPKAALKRRIAGICTQNNAEFAVTIMQQVTHGYLDERSAAFGVGGGGRMVAITHIVAEICVYDRKGNVVIQASAKIPNMGASPGYGYNFSPNDAEEYAQLYVDGAANILMTILALDPSAAISAEGLMEALSVELATVEDDDEND